MPPRISPARAPDSPPHVRVPGSPELSREAARTAPCRVPGSPELSRGAAGAAAVAAGDLHLRQAKRDKKNQTRREKKRASVQKNLASIAEGSAAVGSGFFSKRSIPKETKLKIIA